MPIEQTHVPICDEEYFIGNAVNLLHAQIIPEFDILVDQWDDLNVDLSEQRELLDERREHLLLQPVLGLPRDLGLQFFTRHLILLVLGYLDVLLDQLDGFFRELVVPRELF